MNILTKLIYLINWPIRLIHDAYTIVKPTVRSDIPPRNWGVAFIVVSFILFILYAVLESAGWKIPAALVGIIAGALLTSGLFTILLGFQEFIEFASRILAGIMKDNGYLKKLTAEEKSDVRYLIEKAEYGVSVVNDPKGPYEFLTGQYKEIYKMPYRRKFIETYKLQNTCTKNRMSDPVHFPCKNCPGGLEEHHWCMEGKTTYELHFRHLLKSPEALKNAPLPGLVPIPVGANQVYYAEQVREHLKACTSLDKTHLCLYQPLIKIVVHGTSKEYGDVKAVFISTQRPLNAKEPEECSAKEPQITQQESMVFDETASLPPDMDANKLFYAQYFDINTTINTLHEPRVVMDSEALIWLRSEQFEQGMVSIEISEVTFICRNDNVNCVYFSYPVNQLTATYRIEDKYNDYVFSLTPFGMFEGEKRLYEKTTDLNFITFTLTGWMVRGHGYALHWVRLDPDEVGKETSKQVVGTAPAAMSEEECSA